MEISIDLKLMNEIVFKDTELLHDMLEEWIEDSGLKLTEIRKRLADQNWNGLFNKIHELKTNFSMVYCATGIQYCEKLISCIESKKKIVLDDILQLENIVDSVTLKIKQVLLQ